MYRIRLQIILLCLLLPGLLQVPALGEVVQAQITNPVTVPAAPLTLSQALDTALKHYPSIDVSQAKINAANTGVSLARTAYLPSLDVMLQENRATVNNITGLLFQQGVIPLITGPVNQNPSINSAWGSAAGTLLTWEPFDFGLRHANVNLAKAQLGTAVASKRLAELSVITTVSDAYFKALAAKAAVQAQAAKVKRAQVFVQTVTTLVNNGLRPGVDLTRAIAEAAAAQIVYIQAVGKAKEELAYLAQVMGEAGQDVEIQGEVFWSLPVENTVPDEPVDQHPRLMVQQSTITQVKAKEKSLAVSYRPKVAVQGAFFAKGSGVDPQGNFKGGAHGLYPTRANGAVAVTMVFPVMTIASLRAQQQIEQANEHAELARYNEIKQEVVGAITQAKILSETASSVAEQTPLELKAARASEVQIRTRYKAGLATSLEVADAERQLTQAEIDDALAKIEVWRSRLTQYLVQGDLKGFNTLIKETEQGAPQ